MDNLSVGCVGSRSEIYSLGNILLTLTDADDGSVVPGQAHPAHNPWLGWTDGLLAAVNAVNVSPVQASEVFPANREPVVCGGLMLFIQHQSTTNHGMVWHGAQEVEWVDL